MRCERMGAQTLRSKSSRTAYITSRMSSPMLWLNSSNGMPRYNGDYRMLWEAHEELTYSRREGKEASAEQQCQTIVDFELDIDSASQNLHHKGSRREPDETRDSFWLLRQRQIRWHD